MPDWFAPVISVIALFGVIVAPVIQAIVSWWLLVSENREKRRKEQRDLLIHSRHSLVKLRGRLQYLQIEDCALFKEQQEAYGEAHAEIIAINDSELWELAETVIKPTSTPSQKLDAISDAIKRIGRLISEGALKH
ncbi:MAG: hypothetical protein KBH93_12440 [Anaerolineae bacterium]|nr:hypothetical protein [Anaerolineae bacterium]